MEPSQDSREKIRRYLKITGLVLLGAGAALLIVGLLSFFGVIGGKLFWMAMLGVLFAGAGVSFLLAGSVKNSPPAVRKGFICPKCGKENPAENKFCGECGAKLQE